MNISYISPQILTKLSHPQKNTNQSFQSTKFTSSQPRNVLDLCRAPPPYRRTKNKLLGANNLESRVPIISHKHDNRKKNLPPKWGHPKHPNTTKRKELIISCRETHRRHATPQSRTCVTTTMFAHPYTITELHQGVHQNR